MAKEKEPDKCQRCGQCCYHTQIIDGKKVRVKCEYMEIHADGKTSCRTYASRLGKKVGEGYVCAFRSEVRINYPGCPYNKEHFKDI